MAGLGQLSGIVTYRSKRFTDEANQQMLAEGASGQLRWSMEFDRKRWQIEAFASNLLDKGVSDNGGIIVTYRF